MFQHSAEVPIPFALAVGSIVTIIGEFDELPSLLAPVWEELWHTLDLEGVQQVGLPQTLLWIKSIFEDNGSEWTPIVEAYWTKNLTRPVPEHS